MICKSCLLLNAKNPTTPNWKIAAMPANNKPIFLPVFSLFSWVDSGFAESPISLPGDLLIWSDKALGSDCACGSGAGFNGVSAGDCDSGGGTGRNPSDGGGGASGGGVAGGCGRGGGGLIFALICEFNWLKRAKKVKTRHRLIKMGDNGDSIKQTITKRPIKTRTQNCSREIKI